jgi:hypothetical protein
MRGAILIFVVRIDAKLVPRSLFSSETIGREEYFGFVRGLKEMKFDNYTSSSEHKTRTVG